MAALLHDHPRHTLAEPVARFFALEPAVVEPEADERPVLRVIPGGREAVLRRRLPEHVYRARRRAVAALGVLVLALVVAAVSVRTLPALDALAAEPAPAPASAGAATPVVPPSGSYVVQPGDTLWSIAESLAPDGDVRPLVDQLAERAGPGPLQAGARLDLTGLAG
jgi:hypothetical protein